MPMALWVRLVCQEFQCDPLTAVRNIEAFGDGFLDDVMEAGALMAAKAAVDQAEGKADMEALKARPLCAWVMEQQFAEAREALGV